MENTDKIQDKVVTMLDALQQGAATVGDQVVKYTPDVVDAGLWVIRIDSIQTLVFSLFGLLLSFVGFFGTKRLYVWIKNTDSLDELWGLLPVPIILTIILFLCNLTELFNVWNWVAIFEPKLYLAKQIIDSVIK